jgi:transcriptional regulator with XRE-family HTH domain
MPRHGVDNAALEAQIPATRSEMADLVGLLTSGTPVTQTAVAEAAGWTPSYLSQFLRREEGQPGERRPKPEKMGALIGALDVLVAGLHADIRAQAKPRIAALAELYGLELAQLTDPTLPMREAAPNFVAHGGIARFIDSNVDFPGLYAFDSGPRGGVSTAMRQAVTRLAAAGYDVVQVSLATLLKRREKLDGRPWKSGVVGMVASQVPGLEPDALQSASPWEVNTMLRDALRQRPDGTAFVLDEIDALDADMGDELMDWLRDIKGQRADGDIAFARVTAWVGFTASDSTASARDHSWLFADESKTIPWFGRPEVKELASRLVARAAAKGAGAEWMSTAADAAFAHFAGQPQLTHQFLWDSSQTGDPNRVPRATSGPYKSHLDVISRLAIGLLGEDGAEEVARSINEGRPLPSASVHTVVVRLRLCRDDSGTAANAFYRDNFAANLAHRLAEDKRKGTRA